MSSARFSTGLGLEYAFGAPDVDLRLERIPVAGTLQDDLDELVGRRLRQQATELESSQEARDAREGLAGNPRLGAACKAPAKPIPARRRRR